MNRSAVVASAGFGLNLALGSLYAWSVIGKQLTEPEARGGFGWSKTQSSLPYTAAIVCLSLAMAPAGRMQDKYGPRMVATVGALLAGAGLFLAGFASPARLMPAVVGFGLCAGAGVGLGYAAATPAAVKGFPVHRRGLVTGFVVAGFGLAPVYIAPFAHYLLAVAGIGGTFRILGVTVALLGTGCAVLLANPLPVSLAPSGPSPVALAVRREATWTEVLLDPNFATLYLQFAGGSVAGLMIIGHLAKIVSVQSADRVQIGFLLVALLAIFNAGGRVLAGLVSDRIGRNLTIAGACAVQAVNLLLFSRYSTLGAFIGGAAVAGACYGACASLFASAAVDCWGSKNFGLNYGMLFTSWGVAGVVGPLLAGHIADTTGSFSLAYRIAAAIVAAAAGLALLRQMGMPGLRGDPERRPQRGRLQPLDL